MTPVSRFILVLAAGFFALVVMGLGWLLWIRKRSHRLAALQRAGRWEEALALARQWAERPGWANRVLTAALSPSLWEKNYASHLQQSGRAAEAILLMERLRPRLRRPILVATGLGTLALWLREEGRLEDSEREYAVAIEAALRAGRAGARLAPILRCNGLLVQNDRGRFDDALALLQQADPAARQLTTHYNRAHFLLLKGSFPEALGELLRAQPGLESAWNPASLRLDLGAEAWTRPEKNEGRATIRLLAWISAARLAESAGWPADPGPDPSRGPWQSPLPLPAYRLLALPWRCIVLARDGQKEEALRLRLEEEALRAVVPSARFPLARVDLAFSRLGRLLGAAKESLPRARRALEWTRVPLDRHEALHELGRVHEDLGDPKEAAGAYRRCLEEKVDSFLARDAALRLRRIDS